ncbi:shikimate dehydrogenase [Aureimonas sp. Leaf454]|uniref:shikimate dehydrogenase n=1 Tax=Aureimonas sp. Leaf454 TaxID=1736381 RepID=UPI0006F41FB8|nr:shikimate dehydrogenase [Aureimonas sp. Leaf454]KQT42920.1 shikimate dehydrogenase [Aureimonas sp. Leaf454]
MAHVFEDDEAASPPPEGPEAFVTGWPVWQSRSPLIHGTWLATLGLPGSYVRLGIPPEEMEDFLAGFLDGPYVGGNVTIPHKEAVFRAVSKRDAAADAIGAVNTLWREGTALVGGNTDSYGFAANLDERLSGWADAGEAVVLGAGGAARAVVHALLERGVKRVSILNRTSARAEALAESFGPGVSGHGEEERAALFGRADLLVNTVPIPPVDPEMARYGYEPKLPDLCALPDHALVTDIVYVPVETPTLRAAAARGLRTADGLGMLLHQAVPGFERWFGRRPEVTEDLRALVLADIAKAG